VERRATAGDHRIVLHARYGTLRDSVARQIGVLADGLGRVLWTVPLDDEPGWNEMDGDGLALTPDGRLLALEGDGRILVIRQDGSVERRYEIDAFLAHGPPAVGATGTAYYGVVQMGTGFSGLLTWSPVDGGMGWTFNVRDFSSATEELPYGGVAVDAAENLYFVTEAWDMPMWSVSRQGALRWRAATRPYLATRSFGWVVLVHDSLAVALPSRSDSAVAISTADGTPRWTAPGGDSWGQVCRATLAVGSGGTVYVPASGGGISAVSPAGTVLWNKVGGTALFYSPVVSADAVYGAVRGGGAVRVRIPSAAVDTIGRVEGSPPYSAASATLGRNDVLYVAGTDTLYSFAPDNTRRFATPMQHYGAGCWRFGDAPVIGDDGTVYVHTDRGGVMAFRDTVGPSATAPWPTFQGNFQRTGRVATGN
jgi:hypothetical protein